MRLHASVALLCVGAGIGSLGCTYSAHPPNGVQQCGGGTPRCPDGYVCAANNHCYVIGQLPSGLDGGAADTMVADAGADSRTTSDVPENSAPPDAFASDGGPDLRPTGDQASPSDPPTVSDSADAQSRDDGPDALIRPDLPTGGDGNDAASLLDTREAGSGAEPGPDALVGPDVRAPVEAGSDSGDVSAPDSRPDGGLPDAPADQAADSPPDFATPTDVCPSSFLADPLHCGACGHSCWAGACLAGKCQPAEVASGQHDPADITVDNDHVFWAASTDGKVLMAPRRGGSVQVVAENQSSPSGLLVDQGYVYWTNCSNVGSIWRRPINLAGAANLVADGLYYPTRMAVLGTNLYWNESSTAGVIRRTNKAGGGVVDILFSEQSSPYGIVIDSTNLYWSVWQTIRRTPIAIGAISTISNSESFPYDMRGDADNLYWLDGYAGAIRKAAKTSSEAAITLASSTATTSIGLQLALDDTSVYWPDTSRLTISSVSKQGGPVTDWATNLGQPRGVAVDAEFVFWTDVGTGQVMRLAK